jgi:hypothetical protein
LIEIDGAAAGTLIAVALDQSASGGIIALPGTDTTGHRALISALSVGHRLPAVYSTESDVRDGRPDILWHRPARPDSEGGWLPRSQPQGGEPGRSTHPASDADMALSSTMSISQKCRLPKSEQTRLSAEV